MSEEIQKLKTNHEVIMERLKNAEQSSNRIEKKLDKYITEDRGWKKNVFSEMDKRYSPKYLETLTTRLVMPIVAGVVIALILMLVNGG